MIGDGATIDAAADARLVVIDGVRQQHLVLLINEFRVKNWKIKERRVPLIGIGDFVHFL